MFFVTVGITVGAPVIETTLEFVHGVGVLTVPIHEPHGGDAILAGIAYVLNVMVMTGMRMVRIGTSHEIVIFQVFGAEGLQSLLALMVVAPGSPFEGLVRLIHTVPPSFDGFRRNTVGDHTVHTQIPVAGRGDGDMFKGVEPRLGFKQSFECQAAFFQKAHNRFAVSHQFFLEIKHHVLVTLLFMPAQVN